MCPPPELHVHATPEEAFESVAQLVCSLSAGSIAARGRFTVALGGGSTPAALYRLLASSPLADDVDWSRWHVFWGDERCVPPDHPDSNFGMARRTLLDHVPIPPSQVYRMVGEDPPQQAAADYALALADALAPDGRLDLALLGIGDDGHTASLFPGTAALEERELTRSRQLGPPPGRLPHHPHPAGAQPRPPSRRPRHRRGQGRCRSASPRAPSRRRHPAHRASRPRRRPRGLASHPGRRRGPANLAPRSP